MNCFHCGSEDTAVIDSRLTCDGRIRRRRHYCNNCEQKFTSLQIAVAEKLVGGNYADDITPASAWGSLIRACLPKLSVTAMCEEIQKRFRELNHE